MLAECDRCLHHSFCVLLHHQSCGIPPRTMCLNRGAIKAEASHTCSRSLNMLSVSSDVTPPRTILHVSHSLPDPLPSFSFSSCPSSRNSRRRARWRRTGGRPAPPTPPAARVMSQQPDGKTGSSGCKRSSPPSDEERRHKRDELEGYI